MGASSSRCGCPGSTSSPRRAKGTPRPRPRSARRRRAARRSRCGSCSRRGARPWLRRRRVGDAGRRRRRHARAHGRGRSPGELVRPRAPAVPEVRSTSTPRAASCCATWHRGSGTWSSLAAASRRRASPRRGRRRPEPTDLGVVELPASCSKVWWPTRPASRSPAPRLRRGGRSRRRTPASVTSLREPRSRPAPTAASASTTCAPTDGWTSEPVTPTTSQASSPGSIPRPPARSPSRSPPRAASRAESWDRRGSRSRSPGSTRRASAATPPKAQRSRSAAEMGTSASSACSRGAATFESRARITSNEPSAASSCPPTATPRGSSRRQGRVLDADEAPVEIGFVSAGSQVGSSGQGAGIEEGRYRIEGLEPGRYRLEPGASPKRPRPRPRWTSARA